MPRDRVLLGFAAHAATYTVKTTSDSATVTDSLRWHLARVTAGDRIEFSATTFPAGTTTTITLGSQVGVGQAITLSGAGRVRLACGSAMTVGSGLAITAGAVVEGLKVSGCPDHGIAVTTANVTVRDNAIDGNKKFGVLVTGLPTVTYDVLVTGNYVSGNCANTTATCAGIGVRRGTGTGAGPLRIEVTDNYVGSQLSAAGHGIAVLGGDLVSVLDNHVDGNTGHGVVCSAQTGLTAQGTFARNLVVNNAGVGLQLGARCSPSTVSDNLVGTDGVLPLGNTLSGIEVFGSDGHTIVGNVVSDNLGAGVLVNGLVSNSPAQNLVLEGNLIGLTADGLQPLGNGGNGMTLEGKVGVATLHVVEANTIGGNGGDGVRVVAQNVSLYSNFIGTNAEADAGLGNAGDGVRVLAGGEYLRIRSYVNLGDPLVPNLILANGGDGVYVNAAEAQILGATIARNTGDGVDLVAAGLALVQDNLIADNGSRGIHVGASSNSAILERNAVRENLSTGITVDAGSTTVRWTANEITANTGCGFLVDATVNGTPGGTRPTIQDVADTLVRGTFTVPAGRTLSSIEVFSDPGAEFGRYLGAAALTFTTATTGTFTWRAPDLEPLLASGQQRVSAFALYDNGSTSRPEVWCGDGCVAGVASCNDGNRCTTDTCVSNTCTHVSGNNAGVCDDGDDCSTNDRCSAGMCSGNVPAVAGFPCIDDDACTEAGTCDGAGICDPGATTAKCNNGDDDPCTGKRTECDDTLGCELIVRAEGYACGDDGCTRGDTCDDLGICGGGTQVVTCPEARAGVLCTCDPSVGCSCEPNVADGCCTPWELETDGNGDLLTADCYDPDPLGWDRDEDGFPNVWEDFGGIDLNCDGDATDTHETIAFTPGKDVFWEFDAMAPLAGHDHVFDPDEINEVILGYGRGSINLQIDTSGGVPHLDVLTVGQGAAPDRGEPSWASHQELMRQYFTPSRYGIYHYAVNGHQILELEYPATGYGGAFGFIAGVDFLGAQLFFHESGHTMGLNHGAKDQSGTKTNGNLNHPSSINYTYGGAFDAREHKFVRDFSHVELNTLDETSLNEGNALYGGVGGAVWDPTLPLYRVKWSCDPIVNGDDRWWYWGLPHADVTTDTAADRAVDLNCNGFAGDPLFFSSDLDGDAGTSKDNVIHYGNDDWRIVLNKLPFQSSNAFRGSYAFATPEDELEVDKYPVAAEGVVYPACSGKGVPTANGYKVPVVLYGSADYDPTAHTRVRLNGTDDNSRVVTDWDDDGIDDLFLRFRTGDLTKLSSSATTIAIWAEGEQEAFLNLTITRSSNPLDADADGIHDACDDCDTLGTGVGPDGCPL